MLEWKRLSNGRTAFMLDGARRVGKSYIAEEFARNEYDAYLIIDFAIVTAKVKRYFNEYLEDLDTFFMYLLSAYHVELPLRKSVIIFDEVQRFPRAREAIKYLVKDGRYDYIETGSLISIHKNVKNIVIPSEERHFEMYPMDFDEFLIATGNSGIIPVIEHHFTKKEALDNDTHQQIMDLFRQYMIVGGMPQVVEKFIENKNLREVDESKRSIIDLYLEDINKFAGPLKNKALAIFNSIPAQLSKHEKRFSLSNISKNARYRDFTSVFEWLKYSMTVNLCYGANAPEICLSMNTDYVQQKCYLGDTGLLISLAFNLPELLSENIHERLLSDSLSMNKGMIIENIVAQMLRAEGRSLYYYSASDNNADDRMEIDFLLENNNLKRQHNIIPVEVKSNKEYSHVSLNKFRNKFKEAIGTPVVLHPKNLKIDNGILYLPLYMASLLARQ